MRECWVVYEREEDRIAMYSGEGDLPGRRHPNAPGELCRLRMAFPELVVYVYYSARLTARDAMFYTQNAYRMGEFDRRED